MRVVLSTKSESVAVVEGSDEGAVDVPLCGFGSPDDAIVVPCFDWCSDIVVDSSVVSCRVAFSEEVGFDGGVGRAKPFPVNLVEVVGFEDEGADDTGSWRSLQIDINLTEKYVFLAANSRGGGGGGDLEFGAAGAVGKCCAISQGPAIRCSLCEVGEDGVPFSITWVGRTSWMMLELRHSEVKINILFSVGLQSVYV